MKLDTDDPSNNGDYISDSVKDTVNSILSYRKDKLSSITSARNTSTSAGTTAEIMRTTALANLQWLLNQRLTKVAASNGQLCTAQEAQRIAAEKRYSTLYQAKMQDTENPPNAVDIAKEILFTLVDINHQC